jgi:hypothetical protein
MERDLHICICLRGATHSAPHIGCCLCIQCFFCGSWIQKRHWPKHQAMSDCKPIVPQDPTPEELAPAPVVTDDSLRDAAHELGLSEDNGFDAAFRIACRSCVGDLIDILGGIPQGTKVRTRAWSRVLEVLTSERDSEIKVSELLTLFPEDARTPDLEVQMWEVVANANDLIPELQFA